MPMLKRMFPGTRTEPSSAPVLPQRNAVAMPFDILWRSTGSPSADTEVESPPLPPQPPSMDFSLFIDELPENKIPPPMTADVPEESWVPATVVGHTLKLHFVDQDVLLAGLPGVLTECITQRGYALIMEVGTDLSPRRAFYAALALGKPFLEKIGQPTT